ncbi:MAG: hypothetical protein ACR2FV_13345 [Ornithinimicrobium sp.]|uniref:hypothetical protein n=1 Tax=Ornithinimicrobium sp. TaxID=1977084 RepID=UPI003D9B111E
MPHIACWRWLCSTTRSGPAWSLPPATARPVFGAASSAALPDLVPRHRLSAASSANEGRDATLSMVGPVVDGALIVVATWAPFAFAALTFAMSGAC